LWTEKHARHLIPDLDAATESRFAEGRELGLLATRLYPGGLEVSTTTRRWSQVASASEKALRQRRPLYEAGFVYQGAACRVDILNPVDGEAWEVIEVKSSTGIKDIHLEDMAFQAHVLEGAGLRIRDYYLLHIDPTYVRGEALALERLFRLERVTDAIGSRKRDVPPRLRELRSVLHREECPEVAIGAHCDEPYVCPLKPACWAFLPTNSVLELRGGRKRGFELLSDGIVELTEIPETFDLTTRQAIQVEVARSGRARVDRKAIEVFLGALTYPLSFFDIETFSAAIPPFENSRPYQQIPFLFSIHRIEEPGAEARHFSYQYRAEGDPRPDFLRAVRTSLGIRGSIVAFNAPFESRVLSETAEAIPELESWSHDIDDRFVDLLEPFRSFHFYHPEQHGSASLKAVLPAITGMSYDGLEIAEGAMASREYVRVMQPGIDPVERDRVLQSLEEYCSLDTQGMVAIFERLRSL